MSNTTDVQLMIGDTAAALFTAAEIQTFLTISEVAGTENVFAASALACRSLAASAVLLDKAEEIGNYNLDRKGLATKYETLADKFDKMITDPATAPIPAAVGVIQFAHTDDIARQIVVNDAMRE